VYATKHRDTTYLQHTQIFALAATYGAAFNICGDHILQQSQDFAATVNCLIFSNHQPPAVPRIFTFLGGMLDGTPPSRFKMRYPASYFYY
jgi:hypothetical protein